MPLIAGDNRRGRTTPARPPAPVAAAKIAGHVARVIGVARKARPETVELRLAICGQCSMRAEIDGVDYCGHKWKLGDQTPKPGCGCRLSRKTLSPHERCPEGQWEREVAPSPGSEPGRSQGQSPESHATSGPVEPPA